MPANQGTRLAERTNAQRRVDGSEQAPVPSAVARQRACGERKASKSSKEIQGRTANVVRRLYGSRGGVVPHHVPPFGREASIQVGTHQGDARIAMCNSIRLPVKGPRIVGLLECRLIGCE